MSRGFQARPTDGEPGVTVRAPGLPRPHYPRAVVELTIAIDAPDAASNRVASTFAIPTKASVSRRSHNVAGTAEITVDGAAMPFDLRDVLSIYVRIYLADASAVDADIHLGPGAEDRVEFVGFVDDIDADDGEKGSELTLKCRDLSSILRDFKPLPKAAIGTYGDTLGVALQRILDAVPQVRDRTPDGSLGPARLVLRDHPVLADVIAAGATKSQRLRTAPVQFPNGTTAWGAIEYLCGLLGVVPIVDLGELVVRTAREGVDGDTAAQFEFGTEHGTLLSVNRSKKFARNNKGLKLVAHLLHGATLTAIYPPDGEVRSQHRRGRGRAAHLEADRELVSIPYNTDDSRSLETIARQLYEQRSRWAVEGKLVTPFWRPNIIALRNGDLVQLKVRPDLAAALARVNSRAAGVALLMDRLTLDQDAAGALYDASSRDVLSKWYVRAVTHEFDGTAKCTTTVEILAEEDAR